MNIFVQNTFSLSYPKAAGSIFQCAKMFHENDYPIIIIETKNGGGDPALAYLQIQLFQMREVERTYSAIRYSEINKKNVRIDRDYGPDVIYAPDTCKTINSFEEFKETIDYYNYSDLNITHKRTNVYVELCTKNDRKALNSLRKEYENSKNLKKPTDIIVFTDGYSFSSGSTFIKGLQNIGGAIIVGYFGNPKIKGNYLFDGSLSDSGNSNFIDSEINPNLIEFGFYLGSMTSIEVFNDDYKNKNPIPREYTMIPIDYRVEYYSLYSDDKLDVFIKEGKEIHRKFNEEKYCNYNNTKLLLHVENKCKEFPDLEHAHGGYKCGKNNIWNESDISCAPYYCDIGYSFDQAQRRCVSDCMVDWNVNYLFEDNYTNTLSINKNENFEFRTLNPDESYYYIFQSSEDVIERCPQFCTIHGYYILNINKDKKSKNDITLKINTIKSDAMFIRHRGTLTFFEMYLFFKQKKMLIFQSDNEHILLFTDNLQNNNNKMKYLKYNDTINYQDIINVKNDYFVDNNNNSLILEKGIPYIIYPNYETDERVQVSINPTEIEEDILMNTRMNYLYLKKDRNYTLKYGESFSDFIVKLSKETLNSIVKINDKIINSDNLYYLKEKKTKELKLKIENNDAIIEMLYNVTNMYGVIYDINIANEKSEFFLTKLINVFKIPKGFKNLKIEIKPNDTATYAIYQGYSILPFSHYSFPYQEKQIPTNILSFNISNPYNSETKLMDNETYILTISINSGNLTITINVDKGEKKGLQLYEILLIVFGSVLFVVIIIVIIIIIKKKRGVTNKVIEDKIEGLTSV